MSRKEKNPDIPAGTSGEQREDGRVIRLLKKRKKNIFSLIFSRTGSILVLMILEIMILMSAYNWLADYFTWFAGAQTVFCVIMYFHLFNSDLDASAKLTWLMLLSLFPVPASILLLFTEKDISHRAMKARLKELITQTKGKLRQDPETIRKPELIDSGTDDLCRYLNLGGNFPVYEHSQADYYPLGDDVFPVMLEELEKAEKFIFLEYFIIDEGYVWGRILDILCRKAASGVDVRVMYDGMCEMSTLSHDYGKRLAGKGIKCKPFSPIYPFISTYHNYRDHRKIMVIDGKVAFNGGVNLADEYMNRISRFGHWKDTAVCVKGMAVQSYTLMFLQMWNLIEPNIQWDEFLTPYPLPESDGFIMPYADSPLDEYKVGENVYCDILNRAKSYVHIMTPYLILDNELENALKFAAQRGIDVKLILPGIPDKKAVYALAKSHYPYLVKAGVQIYEYTPGFVHAKVFVSDDEKAAVGTINCDYRSLYHHFECATYLYRTGCIRDIEADFQETLGKCRKVTPETIKKEKLFYRITGSVMKLIAPLM